jgi:succinoglycan biosynthesis protein ExoM
MAGTLAFACDAVGKLAVGFGLWLVFRSFDRPRAFRYGKRAATNLGKLRGAIGARPMAAWG